MQPDDVRVELREYRDSTDDTLQRDAQREAAGQPAEVRPRSAVLPVQQGAHQGEQGHNDQHKGQQPVPEFDCAVDAEFRMGDVGVRGTSRPGWTAEP